MDNLRLGVEWDISEDTLKASMANAKKELSGVGQTVEDVQKKVNESLSSIGNGASEQSFTRTTEKQAGILRQVGAEYRNTLANALSAFSGMDGAAQRNFDVLVRLEQELDGVTGAQSELSEQYKRGAVSQRDYLQGARALAVQENEVKARIAEVNKSIQQNTALEREAVGSISQKTAKLTQLEQQYKKLSAAQREHEKVGGKIREEYKKLTKEVQQLNQSLNGTGSSGLGQVLGQLKNIAGAMGIAFGVQQLVSFGMELFDIAKKAEGVRLAFARVGDASDLQRLRDATKGTVDDLQLMQLAVRADNFKIPLDVLAKGLEFARQRATDTGKEVDYLVNSFVDGIGRKSKLVLDNLGISASELQEEVKKVGDFATAVGNIMEREMAKGGNSVDTLAEKTGRLSTMWQNLKLFFSEMFMDDLATSSSTDAIGKMTKELEDANDLGNTVYTERIKRIKGERDALAPLQQQLAKLNQNREIRVRNGAPTRQVDDQILRIRQELAARKNLITSMEEQNQKMNEAARIQKGIVSNEELRQQIEKKREEANSWIVRDDSDRKYVAKLFAEVDALQKQLDERQGKAAKKTAKTLDKETTERERILRDRANLEAEYLRKSLDKDGQEVQAVKDKFAKMRAEIDKFNSTAKGERISLTGLDTAEQNAINDVLYRQQTGNIRTELGKQANLWQAYQKTIREQGEETAKKLYGDVEDYRKNVIEGFADLNAKALTVGLTGVEAERFKLLTDLMKELSDEEKEQRIADYLAAAAAAQTLDQQVFEIKKKYAQMATDLGDPDNPELKRQRDDEIQAAERTAVEKLAVFQQLYEDLDYMSSESAKATIAEAKRQLDVLLADGKIGQKTYAQVLRTLNQATDEVEGRLPDGLRNVGSELTHIATSLSDIDSGFAAIISSVGSVVGGLGNIRSHLINIRAASQTTGLDKVMGLASGGAGIFGTLLGLGAGISSYFNNARETRNTELQAQISKTNELQLKQTEAVTKLIERQLELINDLYGTARLDKYNASLKEIEANYANLNNKLQGRYVLTGDTFTDSLLERLNNGESQKQILDSFASVSQEWYRASSLFKNLPAFERLGTLPDDLSKAREELQKLQFQADSGKLDDNTAALISQLQAQIDLYNDTLNKLKEEVTGNSFTSVLNDTLGLFFDSGEDAAKNWTRGFDDIIENYMMQRFSRDYLQEAMQDWYDMFDQLAADGLTESEKELLRQERELIKAAGDERLKQLADSLGVDLSDSDSSGITGEINREITEDTANRWFGVQLNIQMLTKQHVAISSDMLLVQKNMMSGVLAMIRHQAAIEHNTAMTVEHLNTAVGHLSSIVKNTGGKSARDLG